MEPEDLACGAQASKAERLRQLQERLHELREDFPEVCLAYWAREEADERAIDDEGEPTLLTDAEWEIVKDRLQDAVYDLVSNSDTLWTTVSEAQERAA
ncbi:hypothetical protein ACIQWR_01065 [Streptomyces sp. NPDC098789]|uniref:hypothetical protein n=1 Tax=Streptomyces sp. NPDC098789 TaxID=3366098 RepID=UPI00380B7EA9